jgi:hypothetical protein
MKLVFPAPDPPSASKSILAITVLLKYILKGVLYSELIMPFTLPTIYELSA